MSMSALPVECKLLKVTLPVLLTVSLESLSASSLPLKEAVISTVLPESSFVL